MNATCLFLPSVHAATSVYLQATGRVRCSPRLCTSEISCTWRRLTLVLTPDRDGSSSTAALPLCPVTPRRIPATTSLKTMGEWLCRPHGVKPGRLIKTLFFVRCLVDATEEESNARFLPRRRASSLQLQLNTFLFHDDSRNSVSYFHKCGDSNVFGNAPRLLGDIDLFFKDIHHLPVEGNFCNADEQLHQQGLQLCTSKVIFLLCIVAP